MINFFDDKQLIANFCYENALDFDLWFANNANHPAKKEHYELSYCEANEKDFLKYAVNELATRTYKIAINRFL